MTVEIRRVFTIEAAAPLVWAALANAGTANEAFDVQVRFGAVTASSFAGGAYVRAILAALDEHLRRAARAGVFRHAAVLEVEAIDASSARLIWIHRAPAEVAMAVPTAIDASAGALMRLFA